MTGYAVEVFRGTIDMPLVVKVVVSNRPLNCFNKSVSQSSAQRRTYSLPLAGEVASSMYIVIRAPSALRPGPSS